MVFIGGEGGGCWGAAATRCRCVGPEEQQGQPGAGLRSAALAPEKRWVQEPAGRWRWRAPELRPASVHCQSPLLPAEGGLLVGRLRRL